MASIKIGQEIATEVIKKAGSKVKESIEKGTKLKKAETLLEKKPIPLKIGDKKEGVVKGVETVTKITKKDIKVKKPVVDVTKSNDALWLIKNTKITPQILADFNINKISSKEDILKLIDITSKLYKGSISAQKRGTRTWEETKKLATILQKKPEDLQRLLLNVKPGQTLNAEQILAARELLVAGMGKLDELAKAAATGNVDEVLKFRQHFALMGEFQKILKGVQTETARALNQFKIPARSKKFSSVQLDKLNEEALLIEFGGIDDIQAVAKLYITTGTKNAQSKLVTELGNVSNFSKASDAIAEVFLNAILSNPMTHIRNSTGNWITQAINMAERRVAQRWFGGKEKGGLARYEDIAKAYGMHQASTEMFSALQVAWRKDGFLKFVKNFDNQIKSNFGGGQGKVELRPDRFASTNFEMEKGGAANTVDFFGRMLTLDRVPTRFLSVMDNFFKNREYRSELYAIAFREAMEHYERGILKQENMASFIADRVINPTKLATKEAWDSAHYITYQTKLASQKNNNLAYFGNLVQKGKSNTGFMSWLANYYLPFIQTPTNIASFVGERTPIVARYLSNYKTNIAKGGVHEQMAITRLRLGAMFYMMVAPFGYFSVVGGSHIDIKGKTTGGKFETLKALGVTNNNISIPVGDKVHNINTTGLDPFNLILSMAANNGKYIQLMTQNVNWSAFSTNEDGDFDFEKMSVARDDIMAHTLALTLGIGEILSNSTFLMGVNNFAKDVQNANRAFSGDISTMEWSGKWFNKFSSSFIPGAIKETGKWTWSDDFQKLAIETNEWYLRNLNVNSLQNDYNLFGDLIPKFGFHQSAKMTPAKLAFKKVLPEIRPMDKKARFSVDQIPVSVRYNSEELSLLKKNSGELFHKAMTELVEGTHDYSETFLSEDATRFEKAAIIKDILSTSRAEAKGIVFPDDDENKFTKSLAERGKEQRRLKILSEQKGKTIPEDNLLYQTEE